MISWYCGKACTASSTSATPRSAPVIESTPPMISIEKTSRLSDGWYVPLRSLCRIIACSPPAMPAIAPDDTKPTSLIRVVGTAIAAAARGLSRVAIIDPAGTRAPQRHARLR